MDNAATSFPKPPGVLEAMSRYAAELGASAGRGAYREALETGAMIAECRRRLARLFNATSPENFVFTLNCTDGLNLAIKGLFDGERRGHVICSDIDHNSVLRPLNALADRGWISVSRLPIDRTSGLLDPDDVRNAIRPDTRLIVVTHVSNVTGTVQPVREIGRIARERGITYLVDAAQAVGHMPIDVQADLIDLMAAPGHKGLLGPLGTGFLYVRPGLEKLLYTTREGGTGSVSEHDRQPDFMPDRFEAGSHNAIGIAGLCESLGWIARQTVEKLAAHERRLTAAFLEELRNIDGLHLYGPASPDSRGSVFSITIDGYSAAELSAVLEMEFGILTRPGIHCAPRVHQTLGTLQRGGTTRFSFGPFLETDDVRFAADALRQIARARQHVHTA